jgi:hypothetical protein
MKKRLPASSTLARPARRQRPAAPAACQREDAALTCIAGACRRRSGGNHAAVHRKSIVSPQVEQSAALRVAPWEFTEVESRPRDDYMRFGIYRHEPTGKHTYAVTLKIVGGIRDVTGWAGDSKPLACQLITAVCRNGTFSPRPYRLGQPHDSTTHTAVWALYAHYCDNADRNPTDLLRRAYPHQHMERLWTPEIWSDVREWAQWEGTSFPVTWDAANTAHLFRALRLLDEASLVDLLVRKLPTTIVKPETTPPRCDTSSPP